MREPAISVIVPVFNTMPYLTTCLNSVVNQSIGLDHLQVIAVDDGSTDGGAEVLNDYAARYPDSFLVVNQPNSGGPALPCNRGLDLATGAFVFFLGADDHLGPEALERLIRAAAEWESDIIFGRMVGEGGRFVDQRMFGSSRRDVGFIGSHLPYTLSNTKLFRRSLLTQHGIRYALDLRVGSDQPFTVAALLKSRRTSVLTSYPFYYAVRRADASNITYSSAWQTRLSDVRAIMDHLADLVPPGDVRDAVLHRHFAWEVTKLVRTDLPDLDQEGQQALLTAVAEVADRYLTPGVARLLLPRARLPLRLAQAQELDRLRSVLEHSAEQRRAPMVLDGDRVFDWAPGFRQTPGREDWYEVLTEDLTGRFRDRTEIQAAAVDAHRLDLRGRVGISASSASQVRLVVRTVAATQPTPPDRRFARGQAPAPAAEFSVDLQPGPVPPEPGLTPDAGAQWCTFYGSIDLRSLLGSIGSPGQRWSVRMVIDAGPWSYDLPIRLADTALVTSFRQRRRRYWIGVGSERSATLALRITTPSSVVEPAAVAEPATVAS